MAPEIDNVSVVTPEYTPPFERSDQLFPLLVLTCHLTLVAAGEETENDVLFPSQISAFTGWATIEGPPLEVIWNVKSIVWVEGPATPVIVTV